ncbi:MAG: hypothetical protein KAH32_03410, partial [Chlamydiia bacterium]|nr:hypothetical protein [Chlamydiia bacterium]
MKIHINRYVPYTSTTREPKPITFALHDNPASGVTDTHMSVGRRLQINMNIAKDKIDKSSYILDSIWDSNTGVVLPITAPNIKALDTIGELYTVLSQTLFTEELKLASWRKSSEKLSDYLGTVVTSLNISRSAIEETKQKYITRLQELEKKIPFAQFHDKAMAIQQAIHMNEQLAWRVMPSVMPVQPPIRELVAQSSVIDMSSNAINVE